MSGRDAPVSPENKRIARHLATVCVSTAEFFTNLLASTEFCLRRSDAVCHPGTVIPDSGCPSHTSSELPHPCLTALSPWESDLTTLDLGNKKVSWLLAVPIADSEHSSLAEHGEDALDRLLQERDVDICDLQRPSVV